MKLTKEQKNQIYNKNMIVDEWEWVPCINHVLRILNYDDTLEHDENYEEVKWSGTEPLIKDEKIRKAVRAWAEVNGIGECVCKEEIHCITFETERGMFISFENADPIPPEGNFTILELCGEENENEES